MCCTDSIGHSTSHGGDATPFGVDDRRMLRTQGSELCSQPWAIRRNSVGVDDGSSEMAGFVGADQFDMRMAIRNT